MWWPSPTSSGCYAQACAGRTERPLPVCRKILRPAASWPAQAKRAATARTSSACTNGFSSRGWWRCTDVSANLTSRVANRYGTPSRPSFPRPGMLCIRRRGSHRALRRRGDDPQSDRAPDPRSAPARVSPTQLPVASVSSQQRRGTRPQTPGCGDRAGGGRPWRAGARGGFVCSTRLRSSRDLVGPVALLLGINLNVQQCRAGRR